MRSVFSISAFDLAASMATGARTGPISGYSSLEPAETQGMSSSALRNRPVYQHHSHSQGVIA